MRAVRLSIAFSLALLVTALCAGATETGPGGEAVDPCLHTCQTEAEQVYHACTEHGGSPADCLNTAKQALSACRDAHCTAPGGGGPGDGGGGTTSSGDGSCREQCGKTVYAGFQGCVAAGSSEDICRAQAREALPQCLADNHCATPPSCADRCAALAGKVNDGCLALGNSADQCTAAAQAVDTRCTADLCTDGATSCEDRCTTFGNDVFAGCLSDAGATSDVCTGRADEARAQCLALVCNATPEPTCPDRCASLGSEAKTKCLAESHPEDVCTALADDLANHCKDEHCTDPTPTCEDTCKAQAITGFQTCMTTTADEATCRTQAEAACRCLRHASGSASRRARSARSSSQRARSPCQRRPALSSGAHRRRPDGSG